MVIGADFSGHVGEGNKGDEELMGRFGVKERNLEGQMVVDSAKRMSCGKHIFPKEGGAQGDLQEWRQEHTGRLHPV